LTRDRSSEDEDGSGDVPMDEDLSEGQAKPAAKKPGDLSEYNLDNYDDDGDNEAELGPFTNIKGLTYYRNNEEDPYITLKDVSSTIASRYSTFYPLYRSLTG
jgi:periodic tryptophan protein 1